LPDVGCVADETQCVGFCKRYSLFFRDAFLDQLVGIRIESARVIEQPSPFQGTQAGIQMIESPIDESEGNYLDVEPLGQERVSVKLRSLTITGPEPAFLPVE